MTKYNSKKSQHANDGERPSSAASRSSNSRRHSLSGTSDAQSERSFKSEHSSIVAEPRITLRYSDVGSPPSIASSNIDETAKHSTATPSVLPLLDETSTSKRASTEQKPDSRGKSKATDATSATSSRGAPAMGDLLNKRFRFGPTVEPRPKTHNPTSKPTKSAQGSFVRGAFPTDRLSSDTPHVRTGIDMTLDAINQAYEAGTVSGDKYDELVTLLGRVHESFGKAVAAKAETVKPIRPPTSFQAGADISLRNAPIIGSGHRYNGPRTITYPPVPALPTNDAWCRVPDVPRPGILPACGPPRVAPPAWSAATRPEAGFPCQGRIIPDEGHNNLVSVYLGRGPSALWCGYASGAFMDASCPSLIEISSHAATVQTAPEKYVALDLEDTHGAAQGLIEYSFNQGFPIITSRLHSRNFFPLLRNIIRLGLKYAIPGLGETAARVYHEHAKAIGVEHVDCLAYEVAEATGPFPDQFTWAIQCIVLEAAASRADDIRDHPHSGRFLSNYFLFSLEALAQDIVRQPLQQPGVMQQVRYTSPPSYDFTSFRPGGRLGGSMGPGSLHDAFFCTCPHCDRNPNNGPLFTSSYQNLVQPGIIGFGAGL